MTSTKLTAIIFIAVLITTINKNAEAQFFKKILNSAGQTVEGRVNSKAIQATNSAVDKVEGLAKPNPKAAGTTGTTPTSASSEANASGNSPNSSPAGNSPAPPNGKDPDQGNSFLDVSLTSDFILAGGSAGIFGTSIQYGSFKDVLITIKGNDVSHSAAIPMTTGGHFQLVQIFLDDGLYEITVQSSDRKTHKKLLLNVFKMENPEPVLDPAKTELERAKTALDNWLKGMAQMLSDKDQTEAKTKFDETVKKIELADQAIDNLKIVCKTLGKASKASGGASGRSGLSPETCKTLSQITTAFTDETKNLKAANDAADHKPYANTVCEYLQMVDEACAAFSTASYFFGGTALESMVVHLAKNIAVDKGVPAATGKVSDAAQVSDTRSEVLAEAGKFCAGTASKIADLRKKLTQSGFANDLVQLCGNYFMHQYCGTMSGNLSQDYKIIYTNNSQKVWWQYKYHNEGTIKLRYLKSAATGSSIKMKGNLEGNATKFSIFQDPNEIDDVKKAMKNRAHIYSLCLHSPPTLPVSTSKADSKTNFGAAARAIGTPAYFNIPIDADYNPKTGQMKIYCNPALVDYSSVVQYIYGYICIAAGIPLTARVDFPINKAYLTINKVIEKNNDFKIQSDSDHKLNFNKDAEFEIGKPGDPIFHHIHINLDAKTD